MDSTIDRLYEQNAALKSTLRDAMRSLKLVKSLHDAPSHNVAGFLVALDPKAYQQVAASIQLSEEVLS